jgi:multidrug efflux pump subunit AcrA (membrane-fusion protein)
MNQDKGARIKMRTVTIAISVVLVAASFYMWGRHRVKPDVKAENARRILYYVDPMHRSYRSDKPGTAPDCGMQLEPVYADQTSQAGAATESVVPGTVTIDPEKQQLIGVRITAVEKSEGTRTVRLLGRVAADETQVYRVSSGVEGWIQQTFDDSVGTQVKKDQQLASFYSRELWSAEQSYIAGTFSVSPTAKDTPMGVQNVTDRLRNLGVSEAQLHELATNRQVSETSYLTSPIDGFILSRTVSAGEKFEKGSEFYRIAGLGRVWIIAEIFENEAYYFQPGALARIALPGGRRSFAARVSKVLPQIDPATRTLKLRLEAANPGFVLRPDMFVDVDLSLPVPGGLSVPADAVIDSGLKKHVFVDRGHGAFEPREVETGKHFEDRVQIVRGLRPSDRVVSAGTFLIDSESKLRAAAGSRP